MRSTWQRGLAIVVMIITWNTGCVTMDQSSTTPADPPVATASATQAETEPAMSPNRSESGNIESSCPEGSVACCGPGDCIGAEICQVTECAF